MEARLVASRTTNCKTITQAMEEQMVVLFRDKAIKGLQVMVVYSRPTVEASMEVARLNRTILLTLCLRIRSSSSSLVILSPTRLTYASVDQSGMANWCSNVMESVKIGSTQHASAWKKSRLGSTQRTITQSLLVQSVQRVISIRPISRRSGSIIQTSINQLPSRAKRTLRLAMLITIRTKITKHNNNLQFCWLRPILRAKINRILKWQLMRLRKLRDSRSEKESRSHPRQLRALKRITNLRTNKLLL